MSTSFRMDGGVIRTESGEYVAELIGYDPKLMAELLQAANGKDTKTTPACPYPGCQGRLDGEQEWCPTCGALMT